MSDVGWLAQRTGDLPGDDRDWLSAGERERAAAMTVAKRRGDFLLGRWTAKRALAELLGTPVGPAVEIAAAADGSPYALLDGGALSVTLALSHRAGLAVAVADRTALPVGCDLEYVEPRTPAFVRDYLTAAEQEYVGPDRTLAANVVWSAKESVLKLLRDGLRRSMLDVGVAVGDVTDGPWTAYEAGIDGGTCHGWWRRLGASHVLTVAYDAERPPPVELRGSSYGG